jgi:hypothetical protein
MSFLTKLLDLIDELLGAKKSEYQPAPEPTTPSEYTPVQPLEPIAPTPYTPISPIEPIVPSQPTPTPTPTPEPAPTPTPAPAPSNPNEVRSDAFRGVLTYNPHTPSANGQRTFMGSYKTVKGNTYNIWESGHSWGLSFWSDKNGGSGEFKEWLQLVQYIDATDPYPYGGTNVHY